MIFFKFDAKNIWFDCTFLRQNALFAWNLHLSKNFRWKPCPGSMLRWKHCPGSNYQWCISTTLSTCCGKPFSKNIKNKVVANQQRTNESRQNADLRARVNFLENEIKRRSAELNEYRQVKYLEAHLIKLKAICKN